MKLSLKFMLSVILVASLSRVTPAGAQSHSFSLAEVTAAMPAVEREQSKTYILQKKTPSRRQTSLLRTFLSTDSRGRELLYYILYQKPTHPIYFVFASLPDNAVMHYEYNLHHLSADVKGLDVPDFVASLTQSNVSAPVKLSDLNDEVLIIVLNEAFPGAEATGTESELRVWSTQTNLFSVAASKNLLRGGPRYH